MVSEVKHKIGSNHAKWQNASSEYKFHSFRFKK